MQFILKKRDDGTMVDFHIKGDPDFAVISVHLDSYKEFNWERMCRLIQKTNKLQDFMIDGLECHKGEITRDDFFETWTERRLKVCLDFIEHGDDDGLKPGDEKTLRLVLIDDSFDLNKIIQNNGLLNVGRFPISKVKEIGLIK